MDQGQSSQRFSPVNTHNLDDMDQFFGSQDYSTTQWSIRTRWRRVSRQKEDYKKMSKSNRTEKEISEPWSPQEEITLCKASINVFENSIEGNAKNVAGLWTEVLTYIEKEEI